jgi:hypothetical protein
MLLVMLQPKLVSGQRAVATCEKAPSLNGL